MGRERIRRWGLALACGFAGACTDAGGGPTDDAHGRDDDREPCAIWADVADAVGCARAGCLTEPSCLDEARALMLCVEDDSSACYCESDGDLNCEGTWKPEEGPAACMHAMELLTACRSVAGASTTDSSAGASGGSDGARGPAPVGIGTTPGSAGGAGDRDGGPAMDAADAGLDEAAADAGADAAATQSSGADAGDGAPPEGGVCDVRLTVRDGCTFDLDAAITEGQHCRGLVELNGQALVCEDTDGWELLDATSLRLLGQPCAAYLGGAQLRAHFPCEIVGPAGS